jgi:hypothetical protein
VATPLSGAHTVVFVSDTCSGKKPSVPELPEFKSRIAAALGAVLKALIPIFWPEAKLTDRTAKNMVSIVILLALIIGVIFVSINYH